MARNVTDYYDRYLKQEGIKTTALKVPGESVQEVDAREPAEKIASDPDEPEATSVDEMNVANRDQMRPVENKSNTGTRGLSDEMVRFAIAFVMRLSGDCKESLMFSFFKRADLQINEEHFKALDKWIKDDGPIARLLWPIMEQGELVMPSDLATLIPGTFERKYMMVLRGDFDGLDNAQRVCETAFRPYYWPVVMPIVHLARHGLSYKTGRVKRLSSLVWKQNVKWSRIVFLCESLTYFKLIDDGPPGSKPVLVDTVTRRERREGEAAGEEGEEVEQERPKEYAIRPSIELDRSLRYHPYGFIKHHEKLISSSRMGRAVDVFYANQSELDRLNEKLLANAGRIMLAAFRSDVSSKTIMKKMLKNAFRKHREDEHNDSEVALELAKSRLIDLLDTNENKFVKFLFNVNNAYWKLVGFFEWALPRLGLILLAIIGSPFLCPAWCCKQCREGCRGAEVNC